jgi:hypothetical protein
LGQHVSINKEKVRFAKWAEQPFSTEIFRITRVIKMLPRQVYELEDLNTMPMDDQFYEELVPVQVSKGKDTRLIKYCVNPLGTEFGKCSSTGKLTLRPVSLVSPRIV